MMKKECRTKAYAFPVWAFFVPGWPQTEKEKNVIDHVSKLKGGK